MFNNTFITFALTIIIFEFLVLSVARREVRDDTGRKVLIHARYRRVQVPASPLLGYYKLLNYFVLFLTHPEASGNKLEIIRDNFPARREVRGFLQGLS